MKILKTLFVIIGIFAGIAILLKMVQKSVKTSIRLSAYNPADKTVTVEVLSNDSVVNTYQISYILGKNTLAANDYQMEVFNFGGGIVFRVLNDQRQEIAVRGFNPAQPQTFTIYSE